MKIYISGKISGLPFSEAYAKFYNAEQFLTSMGHEVFNPMRIPQDPERSWQSYMDECLAELPGCDAIWMLDNWLTSKGARQELASAIDLKKEIYYQEAFLNETLPYLSTSNKLKLLNP